MNQIYMDRQREREHNKQIEEMRKKKIIKERRERAGEIPPLRLGLKLIGPGLEKIIYEKKIQRIYTKPSTAVVFMVIVDCATVQQQQGEKIKPVAAWMSSVTQTSRTRPDTRILSHYL